MQLDNNEFEDLLTDIKNNKESAKNINLSFRELTHQRISALIKELQSNTTTRSLNLSATYMYPQTSYFSYPAFCEKDRYIPSNNITNNRFAQIRRNNSEAICRELATYISEHHSIFKLNLAHNQYGDTAIEPLLDALCKNHSILTLNLSDNDLTDAIIPKIEEILNKNPRIKVISLSYNNFSNAGREKLLALSNDQCKIQVKVLKPTKEAEHHNNNFPYVQSPRFKQRNKYPMGLLSAVTQIMFTLEPQYAYSQIMEAFYAIKKVNKATSLLDILDILRTLQIPATPEDGELSFYEFVNHCWGIEACRDYLFSNAMSNRGKGLMDQALELIGTEYFKAESQNPEERKVNKLIAYACFQHIREPNEDVKTLAFYCYRDLFDKKGLIPSSVMTELQEFRNQNPGEFFELMGKINELNEIEDLMPKFNTILHHYKQCCSMQNSDDAYMPEDSARYTPKLGAC